MIRIFSHFVSSKAMILIGLEALILVFSVYAGISFHAALNGSVAQMSPEAVVFPIAMLIVMACMGLYQLDLWEEVRSVQMRLPAAVLLGACVAFLGSYYLVPSSRLWPDGIGITLIAALAGSGLVRFAIFKWGSLRAFRPRVLVLGTGSRVMKLAEHDQRNPNYLVIGYMAYGSAMHHVPVSRVLPEAPGESLLSVVDKHRINKIVVAIRDRRGGRLPVQQLLECRIRGVKIIELSTFFEREHRQVLLESLNLSWIVLGDGFHRGFFGNAVKRLFDLTLCGALLPVSLPIMLIAALCIFLESGLPVLYRQERIGQGGRIFTLYKLRSMKNDAESDGTPHWATANDDRATWVGRFIRKWRIDELPQIINVFKGEMSFVGPRPERPFFVDQLVKQIPYYALRHSVKPGITGWAQVRYPYGASVDDAVEKLQYELYYVKNHCLFLDLMILIATVEVVLWGKGAR